MGKLLETLYRPVPLRYDRNVTVVCVDCVNPDLGAMAVDICSRATGFRGVIISHEQPSRLGRNTRFVKLPQRLAMDGYNVFVIKELYKHFTTSHCLSIETDGLVVNPSLWDSSWLAYDWIGAPWPLHAGWVNSSASRVGNSGFCLRSKAVLRYLSKIADQQVLRAHKRRWRVSRNDMVACQDHYLRLRDKAFRFAPTSVARRFSVEVPGEQLDSFGCHGKHWWTTEALKVEHSEWKALTPVTPEVFVRVAFNWYETSNAKRQEEIDDALRRMIACPEIHEIVLLVGDDATFDFPSEKVVFVDYRKLANQHATGRPTFSHFVESLDARTGPNDVNWFLNSDCWFDHTVRLSAKMDLAQFWCITRRDKNARGQYALWNVDFSQDAWGFFGKSRFDLAKIVDLVPGTVGCDNYLAWVGHDAGYRVRNPSRDVCLFHNHEDAERSTLTRRPPPYALIQPSRVFGPGRFRVLKTGNFPAMPAVMKK